MIRELDAAALRATCDVAAFSFRSTADLSPLDGMIGQERALSATSFGVGMTHPGYNLFVLGAPATGKSRRCCACSTRGPRSGPWPRTTIEGDRASVAELLALLSSVADIPLSQSLAVTGSVNQQGDVQAVGGINEKIEGFSSSSRPLTRST